MKLIPSPLHLTLHSIGRFSLVCQSLGAVLTGLYGKAGGAACVGLPCLAKMLSFSRFSQPASILSGGLSAVFRAWPDPRQLDRLTGLPSD
ncbi:MAG: hypothetical protein U5L03_17455 [Burkholderiaceae bacterium]|nr:hypothetical protein [Burkholderiaceae bacterium]